ncbi:endonuclease domain-containing protein [Uliginosibacterium sp. H3]|uniref:Endonuclease domain-containing protein n=1 Tax=Uliginosibacterium silvisoli TaxID=3114758 RepID=A0ABU6K1T3_9RHOO|nr:endonuclease domain-containing protein [Uliginosibacterium sp. H3]
MDPEHLDNAKRLRTAQTKAEQCLWYRLRAHRFIGLKFKRQKPIGPYIADFICIEKQLIVEVDGGQHAGAKTYDDVRDKYLNEQGFMVLRFWNNEVLDQTEAVLEKIRVAVEGCSEPSPPAPLPQAGEGG